MTFKEMMELAKAGYKPSEISEMHKLQKEADPEPETETETESETETETESETETETESETETEKETETESETELKKKLDEALDQIKKLQSDNVKKNLAGSKPDEDKMLQDIVRKFM